MKIFAINNYSSFCKPCMQRVSFEARRKQPQIDTFQETQKPEEFYTLSRLAHAGQAGSIEELLKRPEYNTETLKQLLMMQDEDGRTPLHKAVCSSSFEDLLQSSKLDGYKKMFGASFGEEERKNLQEIETIRKNAKQCPQYLATIYTMLEPLKDDPEALKKIFTVRDNSRQTPLTETTTHKGVDARVMLYWLYNYPETLKETLLDTTKHGKKPLLNMLAAHSGQSETIQGLLEPFKNDPETLKELILAQDWCGNTPVHIAIQQDRPYNLSALLRHLKNEPEALREVFLVKNVKEKTPFDYTRFDGGEVSQVVERYVRIVGNANKSGG